jgi:hypothetical protein
MRHSFFPAYLNQLLNLSYMREIPSEDSNIGECNKKFVD